MKYVLKEGMIVNYKGNKVPVSLGHSFFMKGFYIPLIAIHKLNLNHEDPNQRVILQQEPFGIQWSCSEFEIIPLKEEEKFFDYSEPELCLPWEINKIKLVESLNDQVIIPFFKVKDTVKTKQGLKGIVRAISIKNNTFVYQMN